MLLEYKGGALSRGEKIPLMWMAGIYTHSCRSLLADAVALSVEMRRWSCRICYVWIKGINSQQVVNNDESQQVSGKMQCEGGGSSSAL